MAARATRAGRGRAVPPARRGATAPSGRARPADRPLAGRTIVVTRARDQAGGFAARLRRAGAHVLEAPAIEIVAPRSFAPVDRALARIGDYRLLILTSVNGVGRFLDRMRTRRIDIRTLAGLDIVAIGPATAAALEERGLRVAGVPDDFRAEGLVDLLGGRDLKGARILLPRAAAARELLVRALRRRGARVDVVTVYRAVASSAGFAAVRAALRAGGIDLVTFASSSTAAHFTARFHAADRRRLRRVPVAVIGPITAATARRLGFRIAVQPREYTIPALAAAIVRRLGGRAIRAPRPGRPVW